MKRREALRVLPKTYAILLHVLQRRELLTDRLACISANCGSPVERHDFKASDLIKCRTIFHFMQVLLVRPEIAFVEDL